MAILVGTASWTAPGLIKSGRFYPKGCTSAEARLRYYAEQFPLVEVDSSYYALPVPQTSVLWAERTPAEFSFNVKAFRLFTGHQATVAVLPKDIQDAIGPVPKKNIYYADLPEEIQDELWRRFIAALAPLKAEGKLGAVLFQFAPWFINNRDGFRHAEECAKRMDGHLLAVEFRNGIWFDEKHRSKTLDWEREHGFVNVITDGPQGIKNTIPSVWEVTSPKLAILRMHGRNAETWNAKGHKSSEERFNYDYSEAELAGLAEKARLLQDLAANVHMIMNNNYEDQGQRNGATLKRILASAA